MLITKKKKKRIDRTQLNRVQSVGFLTSTAHSKHPSVCILSALLYHNQRFAYQTERSLVVTGFSRHCLYCKPTWPHYLLMHPRSLLFNSPFSSSSHNHQVNKLTLTFICTTWWMEFMFMFSLYIYASHCVEVQLGFIKIDPEHSQRGGNDPMSDIQCLVIGVSHASAGLLLFPVLTSL